MTTSRCWRCAHYQGDLVCAAFPSGIPEALLSGEDDHTRPFPGDQNLRYEPRDRIKDRDSEPEPLE